MNRSPFGDHVGYMPIPTPTAAQTVHVSQLAAQYPETDTVLMALGLREYVSAVNPDGRDAWAKTRTTPRGDEPCRAGHNRAEHAYRGPDGYWVCRACRRYRDKIRRNR